MTLSGNPCCRLPTGKALLDPRLDYFEQAGILKVGAGFVIREFPALSGPGLMDGATFAHFSLGEENAGSILPGAKGVFILQKAMPYLAVADGKVAGNTVDIIVGQQQR